MCYNAVWLLTETTDHVAGETLAEKDKCLKQSAVTAAKNAKCHLSPQAASLFIAGIVFEP